jgi:hypothetical protein
MDSKDKEAYIPHRARNAPPFFDMNMFLKNEATVHSTAFAETHRSQARQARSFILLTHVWERREK